MRLDRYLSHVTGLSRRQAQQAIRRGDVCLNGVTASDPGAPVPDQAAVELGGEALAVPAPRYFMLHKPPGYVCAASDAQHRSVLDLIEAPNRAGLHVAGRLDVDATGLVLITDDGDWSHRVTSPRSRCPKTYRVRLAAPLDEQAAVKLREGVELHGERRCCAPAVLERLGDADWRITLTEGKYHQVKRMFAAVGNRVVSLHRERIGPLTLDAGLPPGGSRPLSAQEIAAFSSSWPAGAAPRQRFFPGD